MSSVDELEEAIRNQPDDVALRAVHGDAVLERGGPGDRQRGQLIQLALAGEGGDAKAGHEAWSLQRKTRARLVKAFDDAYVVRMGWRHGSVESVALEPRGWTNKRVTAHTRRILSRLLTQPELFALRAFDTRAVWNSTSGARETVDGTLALVRGLPIRWLGVAGCTTGEEFDKLHALPQLDGLGIITQDHDAVLTALASRPWLRDLELSGSHDAVPRIVESCPQLTRLVLYRAGIDELTPILERRALPRLRDFGIMTPELANAVCRRLVDSPLLPALQSFGFCASSLYDDTENRAWFKTNRAAFAHVRLFTDGQTVASDRGHEAGRLGMLLDSIDRDREGIDHHMHHLDHSGTDPVHAACWTRVACALIVIDHYSEALRMADRALEVAGGAPTAWMLRTRVHALDWLDRFAESAETSERALAIEGECSWTWRFRGGALRELGRLDEAAAAFDHSIEYLKPTDAASFTPWAHLLRGELRWGRRDHDGAAADFERVLATVEADDTSPKLRARLGLGAIAYHRGDFAAARPHFVEALAVSSREDSDAISSLCATLFSLGEPALALTTWQIAAAQFDWNDIDEQGHVLNAMGRPADALITLAAGLECGGARAMACRALGRIEDALAAVDHYRIRPRLADPACAFRVATGLVMEALLLREAGRGREANQRLAKLRDLPVEPNELHAALLRRLRGHDTSGCYAKNCGRHAAVAVLAGAVAAGDQERAVARARAFATFEDSQLANHVPEIVWDLRAILELAPSPLIAAALATLEHDAPTSPILAAL